MSTPKLPERASLEYLKRLAKERLDELRATNSTARLADAQLVIAREYGFTSWRALKAEIDRQRAARVTAFFRAATAGEAQQLRELLENEPSLVRERDEGDNATALHFAAAGGHLESVRLLLDAGADVHGSGDLHNGGVIGWAARTENEAVVSLLLERGARHHIFSAMAMRDLALVERLVEQQPESLSAHRSRFEDGQTPVHASFAPPDGNNFLCGQADYALLALLIRLGANVEAHDGKGRTPIAVATLRGDQEAIRLLNAAGAREPARVAASSTHDMVAVASSIKRSVPMLLVADMRATTQWYESVGFTVTGRYEYEGELVFARVLLGNAEFTLSPGREGSAPHGVRLWFFTDRVRDLYDVLRRMPGVAFEEDLYEPFHGGQQFSIRDINGVMLIFWQPAARDVHRLE